MEKFPSIEQFRNVIRNVRHRAQWVSTDDNGDPIYDKNKVAPVLKYHGEVKLHGTNAGIICEFADGGHQFSYQSRERVLTLTEDNAGFALFMTGQVDSLSKLVDNIMMPDIQKLYNAKKIAIFGEWCGGNIQKGVGISGLPKMFVIFGVKIFGSTIESEEEDTGVWLSKSQLKKVKTNNPAIFNIQQFPTYEIDIDFNRPEEIQNQLIDLTIKVEEECPVAKQLGQIGIGEGLVWSCVDHGWSSSKFWFKVKGEAHAMKSKVKTLAPVDIEEINSINEFVDEYICENRLKQGLDKLREKGLEVDVKNLGEYIRWVYNDAVKEEQDTIVANQLDVRKLGSPIANKARQWFFANYI